MMNVYCCLARDCMPWIANNLYQVLNFKQPEDKIIIVENNSIDGTKQFLGDLCNSRNKTLGRGNPNSEIIVIGEDDGVSRFGQKPRKDRADYLAGLRNSYLNYIKKHFDNQVDRLVVFDCDLWDLGTQNWHTLFTDYDAVGANGLIAIQVANINHVIMYDTWAYLSIDNDFVHGVKNPIPMLQRDEFREVRSCFGGAACYKWSSVRDCRYSFFDLGIKHHHGVPMTLGEHGGFCKDIRDRGGRIFVQSSCILFNQRFPL